MVCRNAGRLIGAIGRGRRIEKARKSGSHLTPRWRGMDSNFQYADAVNLMSPPLSRRVLGMRRCALSVFGQHDALHQSGVDPTAEAAIRAGDAQRRLLRGPGSCGGQLQQTQILRCRRVLESAKLGYARRSD